ncbi:MAG: exo-alpha-sialidase [Phycisphaerales bacterium]
MAGADILLPDGTPDPAFANLYAWWRADLGVNQAATVPADGASVSRWEDSSVRNRDLTRVSATVTARPVFRAALANGRPAVDFDGDDYIWTANQSAEFGVITTARTVIAVSRPVAADGGYIFDSSSSAGRTALLTGEIATPAQWVLYPGFTPTTLGGNVTESALTMTTCTVSPGAQTVHVNGVLKGSGASAMQNMSGLLLGARYNLANYLRGSISEVLVFDKALDAAERAAVEGYLSAKYDLDEPPPPLPMVDVFVGGQGGYAVYRIPSIVQLETGRLLAFAEGRASGSDNGVNDVVMRASDDLGETWSPVAVVDDQAGRSLNNPCAVEVRSGPHAGRVLMMYQSYPTGCGEGCVVPGNKGDNICRTFVKASDDGGTTWSAAVDITAQVKRPTVVTSVASGPGIGIQLRRGPHAGRLVVPFNQGPYGVWACYAAYSDDGGDSWQYGAVAVNGSPGTGNEVQMVERADGSIMLNSRQFSGGGWRKTAVSSDGGATWSALVNDDELPDPSCMAGLVALTDPIDGFTQSRIVFSGPNSASSRSNGHAWLSTDGGATWPVKQRVYAGAFAYSLPVTVDCDRFGVFFEKDGYTRITLAFVDFTDFTGGGDDFSDEGTCVPAPPCAADLDGSGTVDASDLATLLGAWGQRGVGDLDASGTVDASDLATLLGAWGACP